MSGIQLALIAIAGVVAITLIKQNAPVIALVAESALVIVILLAVIPEIKTLFQSLNSIRNLYGLSLNSVKILLKALTILVCGAIASDICRDNGRNALATAVDISVKVLSLCCALPVLSAVIEIAMSFING